MLKVRMCIDLTHYLSYSFSKTMNFFKRYKNTEKEKILSVVAYLKLCFRYAPSKPVH